LLRSPDRPAPLLLDFFKAPVPRIVVPLQHL
jgi:hypothetical protein